MSAVACRGWRRGIAPPCGRLGPSYGWPLPPTRAATLASGESVKSRRPSWSYRCCRWSRRTRPRPASPTRAAAPELAPARERLRRCRAPSRRWQCSERERECSWKRPWCNRHAARRASEGADGDREPASSNCALAGAIECDLRCNREHACVRASSRRARAGSPQRGRQSIVGGLKPVVDPLLVLDLLEILGVCRSLISSSFRTCSTSAEVPSGRRRPVVRWPSAAP